jgi:hypothetical protein
MAWLGAPDSMARPTRAETEQAVRRNQSEPSRIALRRLVQDAAAAAASEADFFTLLRDTGALIRERRGTTEQGRITGYAVALPGHITGNGTTVWFGGGKLAPDLTLPKLRRRWERSRNTGHTGSSGIRQLSPGSARAVIRSAATNAAEHARNDADYFSHLRASGILVRHRYSELNPGQITGYTLTLDGHLFGGRLRFDQVTGLRSRTSAGCTGPRLRHRADGCG